MPRGKKATSSSLGRSLQRSKRTQRKQQVDQFGNVRTNDIDVQEVEKTTQKKAQSVTEMSDLTELMYQADLEEKDFAADRDLVVILTSSTFEKRFQNQENLEKTVLEEKNLKNLKIPRRPSWDADTTPEDLQHAEKESFLKWRRTLAEVEQDQNLLLTPYEKNLEVWRQLWRVVEKSELLVQIVDARNPLLFYNEDLFNYVKEVEEQQKLAHDQHDEHPDKRQHQRKPHPKKSHQENDNDSGSEPEQEAEEVEKKTFRPKQTLLLVNKSDLLPLHLREAWAHYFRDHNIRFIFFSAFLEAEKEENKAQNESGDQDHDEDRSDDEKIEDESDSVEPYPPPHMKTKNQKKKNRTRKLQKKEEEDEEDEGEDDEDENEDDDDDEIHDIDQTSVKNQNQTLTSKGKKNEHKQEAKEKKKEEKEVEKKEEEKLEEKEETEEERKKREWLNEATRLYSADDLIDLFLQIVPPINGERSVIGMVGYPNVGKSSTINVIYGAKKVAVASTPGKTKTFQTLQVGEDITLCDCPGLVFPSFMSTKADMICNGLLSIDHLRDPIPPVQLLCNRFGRKKLEEAFGITLPDPTQHDQKDRPPFAEEFLQTYAWRRGFMTAAGNPDESRTARIILKQYVKGDLLYCHPPPGYEPPKEAEKEKEKEDQAPDNTKAAPRPILKEVERKIRKKHLKNLPKEYAAPKGKRGPVQTQLQGVAHTTGKFSQHGFTRITQPYQQPEKQ